MKKIPEQHTFVLSHHYCFTIYKLLMPSLLSILITEGRVMSFLYVASYNGFVEEGD